MPRGINRQRLIAGLPQRRKPPTESKPNFRNYVVPPASENKEEPAGTILDIGPEDYALLNGPDDSSGSSSSDLPQDINHRFRLVGSSGEARDTTAQEWSENRRALQMEMAEPDWSHPIFR